MDNRVFYKMLLELNSYDDLPVNNGDYGIGKEAETIRFYYKKELTYLLDAKDLEHDKKSFTEYLRLSDVIAFEFDFELKPMIGNVVTDLKEFNHNGTLFHLDQRTKNTFNVEWTSENDRYYWEKFLEFNLTDEQIETFKTDRIAFSNYLRSDVL